MSGIQEVAQSLNPDAIVSLFTLDTSSLGGPVLNFVQGRDVYASVLYNGQTFEAVDCEFEGLETTGVGALPTPTIRVSNSDGIFQAILNTWGDLLGCTLYRIRTYARFLDNGSEPDPQAFFGPDTFRVERKVAENPVYLEFELSAAIDQEGKKLPGRQVIRDTCLWRYRVWKPGIGWDYSKAQCPYVGNQYFDINDNPVANPEDDFPSRRLGCCKARFGENAPLPFGGFPGVARVRA